MTELKDDPIYRLLEEHYPNLLLDYAVFSADLPYQGEVSHKEAAMAAILAFSHRHRVGNRYDPGPFTLEPDKMQAERYPAELLFDIPDGSSPVKPGTIRYWYAYAEQPYPTGYTAEVSAGSIPYCSPNRFAMTLRYFDGTMIFPAISMTARTGGERISGQSMISICSALSSSALL